MGQTYAIDCGLPHCQRTEGEQARFSSCLRVTGVALGMLAVLTGLLILCGIPALSQLGPLAGGLTLSAGVILALVAASIRCVTKAEKTEDAAEKAKSEKSLEHVSEKSQTESLLDGTIRFDLAGHEKKIEDITLSSGRIASCSADGTVILWSSESGEEVCRQEKGPLFQWHHVALEGTILATIAKHQVYVNSFVESGTLEYLSCFDADYEKCSPHHIAIEGDLIATATKGKDNTRIQVWSPKKKKKQLDISINGSVKDLSIHKGQIVCTFRNKHTTEERVESYSLEDGERQQVFFAESFAAIYEGVAVCVDTEKTTVYALETRESLGGFPQALPYFTQMVFHENKLIGLRPPIFDEKAQTNSSAIAIWSSRTGELYQEFTLEPGWIAKKMRIEGDTLLVCETCDTKGRLWKFPL